MTETPRNERDASGRGRFIPWLIGGFLGLTVIKYMVVMALISNDPSIAVQEDYYQRALAWDERKAVAAASEALGWKAAISIGAAPLAGRSEIVVRLHDDLGDPVTAADVEVRAFHQARAKGAYEFRAPTDLAGLARGEIPDDRRGLWRIEVEASRGTLRFVEERTVIWGETR